MRIFQVVFAIVWAATVYVTICAIAKEGIAVAGDVFSNDVAALGWRGQFDMELLSYMTLAAVWLAWRKAFSPIGIVLGLLCFTVGVTFTGAYILFLTLYHKGDMKVIALGRHAERVS